MLLVILGAIRILGLQKELNYITSDLLFALAAWC